MNKKTIITILLALVTKAGQAQEERIDTVIPKFLSNGYFSNPKVPFQRLFLPRNATVARR